MVSQSRSVEQTCFVAVRPVQPRTAATDVGWCGGGGGGAAGVAVEVPLLVFTV
jgi:hypothetical protein